MSPSLVALGQWCSVVDSKGFEGAFVGVGPLDSTCRFRAPRGHSAVSGRLSVRGRGRRPICRRRERSPIGARGPVSSQRGRAHDHVRVVLDHRPRIRACAGASVSEVSGTVIRTGDPTVITGGVVSFLSVMPRLRQSYFVATACGSLLVVVGMDVDDTGLTWADWSSGKERCCKTTIFDPQGSAMWHAGNALLTVDGLRRLIERCRARPSAHVAAEMGVSRQCPSTWGNWRIR